jgi:hypothetical protein
MQRFAAMSETTPEAIAQWMLGRLEETDLLYQAEVVKDIAGRFGEEFTYINDNGNLAIDKRVLRIFRKISGDDVVWDRWDFCWRRRQQGDAPGRKQE